MQSSSQFSSTSLARRAVLAVLLTIGFYGLAIALIGVLLSIPYAEIRYGDSIHLRLAVFCLVGAGTIAWSILPRRDRFEPPGPTLEPANHPRLFKEIEQVAQDVGQEMPADVYLVPDVNAFVSERGGILGIGRRRIMGLGLPLLQNLTVTQLRAVLAHEFGHYHSGDTRLSPWIYKTRSTIVRTVQNLKDGSWLQKPFLWYGKLFLRITRSISRHQEFVADKLAAQTAGATALIGGLQTIHKVNSAFRAYMQNEFLPIIQRGFQPSLTKGFSAFVHASTVSAALDEALNSEMESSEENPYDTHPPLRARIEAVRSLSDEGESDNETLALSLLHDVPALEEQLLTHLFGADQAKMWTRIEWQDVGEDVYVPSWEASLTEYADALANVRIQSLPDFVRSPDSLVTRIREVADSPVSGEEMQRAVTTITGRALAVSLVRSGWTIDTALGEQVSVRQNGHEIKPFAVLHELASGERGAEKWRAQCEAAGIATLTLAVDANEPISFQPASAQFQRQ